MCPHRRSEKYIGLLGGQPDMRGIREILPRVILIEQPSGQYRCAAGERSSRNALRLAGEAVVGRERVEGSRTALSLSSMCSVPEPLPGALGRCCGPGHI